MALSTLEELQSRYDALTGRIVALDVDISREVDSERRKTLTDRRIEMAIEREKVRRGHCHSTPRLSADCGCKCAAAGSSGDEARAGCAVVEGGTRDPARGRSWRASYSTAC